MTYPEPEWIDRDDEPTGDDQIGRPIPLTSTVKIPPFPVTALPKSIADTPP